MSDLPPGFEVLNQPSDLPPGFQVLAPPQDPQKVGTALDVAESLPSGLAKGVAEAAMFPATLHRMANDASGFLLDTGEAAVRHILGMDPVSPEVKAQREQVLSSGVNDAIYGAQDKVRQGLNDVLHQPQTMPGRFAETFGEFLPTAVVPSRAAAMAPTAAHAVADIVGNIWAHGVAPAALSQGAGELTKGTPLEAPARIAGAVLGNLGSAAARTYNAPEMVLRRAVVGTTDPQWADAVALQNNRTGIRLSAPEAISQATGGGSPLPNLQRLVEGSVTGGARTGPFYAQRPAQVDAAVHDFLNMIAPQHQQPSTIGPRAAGVAQDVIDTTRQGINAQTRPLYQAAETQVLPPAQSAQVRADPAFTTALERLRNDPVLGPRYAGLPDDSVGVVDAVSKDMIARGEAMSTRSNPLYGPEAGALNTQGAVAARNAATTASPEYAQALATQHDLRQNVLSPLEQGPVGAVAGATDTTAAANAILPPTPLVGGNLELADAVRRLAGQDPETTSALIRQALADRYNRVSTETKSGGRESAGGALHKNLAGNPAKEEALAAILGALPNQQAAAVAPKLLDVLQATSRRRDMGSTTASNQHMGAELGQATGLSQLFGLARSLGGSFLTQAGQATNRAALRNSMATLAEMFIDPNAVELVRNAANRGARINFPDALLRSAAQSAPLIYGPR